MLLPALLGAMLTAPSLSAPNLDAAGIRAQSPSTDVSIGVFPWLVGNMDGRVTEIVTNCQTRGIDTVYISVFRATGPQDGDLWITDSANTWNPTWGPVRSGGKGIDLPNLIAACHAAHIRVVGVLKCFDESVQPDDLNHRQYLLDVVDYLVDSWTPTGRPVYDLDGIALDYVRYVGSGGAVASNVTAFVSDVRDHIGHLSLQAYLVANRYTFDGGTYDGNFQSYNAVRNSLSAQYGQDWQALAPLLDVIMPMAYTANGSIYNSYALHQAYVRKTAEHARTACILANAFDCRIIPAIKTYTSTGETTTNQTVDASITGALLGGDGYQSFRYQTVVDNPSWWTPLAAWAVPGCNWPRPEFTATANKLTASYNLSATSDLDEAAANLEVRFDFDDGVMDTPWQPHADTSHLSRHPSLWQTAMQVRDSDGHVATSRRRYATGTPVTVFPGAISTTLGGSSNIFVDVGPAGAGDTYLVIASLSGTSPGFDWAPGFPVPLNVDPVTELLASDPNGGLLSNGLGVFDAQGRATATFFWPPGLLTFLAGFQLHWSFVSQDAQGNATCVGDSKPLLLL